MKKTLLSMSLCAAGITGGYAQKLTYGPELGLNLSSMSLKANNVKLNDVDMKIGFKVGGIVNIPVYKYLYVQPGIFFATKGMSMVENSPLARTTTTLSLNYIEVPVNAVFRYGFSKGNAVFASAGPYIAMALSGRSKIAVGNTGNSQTSGTTEDDIDFGSDPGQMDRLDYGVNFGLGYEMRMGLYFRAQYGIGLANLNNTPLGSIRNNTIQFSVGYLFGK